MSKDVEVGDMWAYSCSCGKLIRILYTVKLSGSHQLRVSHGEKQAVTVNLAAYHTPEDLAKGIVHGVNCWFDHQGEGCSWIPTYGTSLAPLV